MKILFVRSYGSGFFGFGLVLLVLFSMSRADAQSVPADLLDLSIEELFRLRVSDDVPTEDTNWQRWRLRYKYQQSKFEDYQKGTQKLSLDEVTFSPGNTQRSNDNFPVVPVEIVQKVHALSIGYDLSERWSLGITLPFVKQRTEHISIVPGYSDFVIRSDGIGDVSVGGTLRIPGNQGGGWQVSAGFSLPTGSINKVGDTPRAPGDQQLPFSMQTGSGTVDIPVSFTYLHQGKTFNWGGDVGGKIRLGRNNRDYRLGNRFSIATSVSLISFEWIQPSVTIAYQYWGRIQGRDEELLVPGLFPFPAPVTNPSLYGGKVVDAKLSLRFPISSPTRYIEFEFGMPLYQNLNGPQSAEEYQLGLTVGGGF